MSRPVLWSSGFGSDPPYLAVSDGSWRRTSRRSDTATGLHRFEISGVWFGATSPTALPSDLTKARGIERPTRIKNSPFRPELAPDDLHSYTTLPSRLPSG